MKLHGSCIEISTIEQLLHHGMTGVNGSLIQFKVSLSSSDDITAHATLQKRPEDVSVHREYTAICICFICVLPA